MHKSIDLDNTDVRSIFLHYLVPCLIGMLVQALYISVDAIFISRGVGAKAMGALAVITPVLMWFTAIAMMVGVGASAMMSICFGKNDFEAGQNIFLNGWLLISIISIALIAGYPWYIQIYLSWIAPPLSITELFHEHLSTIVPFLFFGSSVLILSCILRNDNNPKWVMKVLVVGAIANIVFDYVFIFQFGLGIKGAAMATGLSQVLMFVLLLKHFFQSKTPRLGHLTLSLFPIRLSLWRQICGMGLPILVIDSAFAISMMIFSRYLLEHHGVEYVIAYSMTGSVSVIVLFIFLGFGQASQPFLSFSHGRSAWLRLIKMSNISIYSAIATAIIFTLLVWLTSGDICDAFGLTTTKQVEVGEMALKLHFLAVPILAFNILVASLFQAVGQPKRATLIALSRGFIFLILSLFILPYWFPNYGVFACTLVAESLTGGISFYLFYAYRKSIKTRLLKAIDLNEETAV